jgi:hypothetical protein|mmetsp:Transcript_86825/g.144451  ORF Transcript_86825/g.144451 Transcript_86825/m.144451 type:complete len:190 (-) Transcript_86825:958-1527(-)
MTLTGQPQAEYGSIDDPVGSSGEVLRSEASGALHTAASWGRQGLEGLNYLVSHTEGISRFCLLGGLAVMVITAMGLFNVFAVVTPVEYLLNAYCLIFGIVVVLLEANADDLERLPWSTSLASWVRRHQELTYEYCKFLTVLWPRGLFYLFIGSSLIAMCHIFTSLVGLWMMICGAICVYNHFSATPDIP